MAMVSTLQNTPANRCCGHSSVASETDGENAGAMTSGRWIEHDMH